MNLAVNSSMMLKVNLLNQVLFLNCHKQIILKDEFQNFRQDMDYADEKYLNLKTQIEGSKKKYISDMRKIQEKMEKLNKIKEQAE